MHIVCQIINWTPISKLEEDIRVMSSLSRLHEKYGNIWKEIYWLNWWLRKHIIYWINCLLLCRSKCGLDRKKISSHNKYFLFCCFLFLYANVRPPNENKYHMNNLWRNRLHIFSCFPNNLNHQFLTAISGLHFPNKNQTNEYMKIFLHNPASKVMVVLHILSCFYKQENMWRNSSLSKKA